jgi:glycosyltransferase involved in cell wall biosynthesis
VTARVLFFRPALADGGADRVTLTLLERLDRARVAPAIALCKANGALVGDVPGDVEVVDLGAPRLALAAPLLARAVARIKPDVLFSTASAANVVAVAAHVLARSRARLVLSERSALRRESRSRAREAIELRAKRVAYRRADVVTAVSEGVAQDLEHELGLPRAKIQVVYNPMVADDVERLAAAPVEHPWFASDATNVLVACGRLVEVKDYPTMLDAFARVRAARPAKLAVLGEGPLRGALEAAVRARGLGGDVAFLGFDKNPYKYMARARLLLQSSRAEGLPGTLIQSMACGTPVVATDCDHGPREVVHTGVDGVLVPVGDPAALATAALRLLTDDPARSAMAAAARKAAARFSVAASLARYQAAIDGGTSGGA